MAKTPADFENLLTKKQLAEKLGLTPAGVAGLVRRRLIPAIRLSHQCVRFRASEVEAALAKVTVKAI